MPSGGGYAGTGRRDRGGGYVVFHESALWREHTQYNESDHIHWGDCRVEITIGGVRLRQDDCDGYNWIILLLILLGSVSFVLFYAIDSYLGSQTSTFSPGDSRLVSFSSYFCDGIDVDVHSANTGASVFTVDTPPPLTSQNDLTISDARTLDSKQFHYWQYHLYPNSHISVGVCTSDKLDVYILSLIHI